MSGQTPSRVQIAACGAGLHRGSAAGGRGAGGEAGAAGGLRFWPRGAGLVPRLQPIVARPGLPTSRQSPLGQPLPPAASFVPAGPVAAAGPRPYDFRPRGPGRVHACAGPARGPPGLAGRPLACSWPCTLSLICPGGSGGSGQSASGGGLWLGVVGTEEHGIWAELQLWLHLSFLVLSAALPVLRGFP